MRRKIIITSPSLDTKNNVSGISSITKLIIDNNVEIDYYHFNNFKNDNQLPGMLRNMEIVKSFYKWLGVIWKSKNNIIHYNYPFEIKSIIRDTPFILSARALRRRLVIHVHGGKYLTNKPQRWVNFFLKIIFRKSQFVIVLSENEKTELTQRYSLNNIAVLANCVELNETRNFNREISENKPLNLLFLGRIDENKGLEDIYQACIILNNNKELKYRLILAGKGPSQEKFVRKFSALLGDNFIFKGVVSGLDKINLLKDCDIFLLPSLFEGLPMALLESMSFGIVPLVTAVGSIPSLVHDQANGIIVSKQAPKEIALAIEYLNLDKNLLNRLGQKSKLTIEERFSMEDYVSKLNEIYNSV